MAGGSPEFCIDADDSGCGVDGVDDDALGVAAAEAVEVGVAVVAGSAVTDFCALIALLMLMRRDSARGEPDFGMRGESDAGILGEAAALVAGEGLVILDARLLVGPVGDSVVGEPLGLFLAPVLLIDRASRGLDANFCFLGALSPLGSGVAMVG